MMTAGCALYLSLWGLKGQSSMNDRNKKSYALLSSPHVLKSPIQMVASPSMPCSPLPLDFDSKSVGELQVCTDTMRVRPC